MDMRMPVMSGEEATRQIKARMAARPDAARTLDRGLTASAFNGNRDHFLACGCDEFAGKPFRAEELFAILERRAGLRFLRARGRWPTADAPCQVTSARRPPGRLPRGLARRRCGAAVAWGISNGSPTCWPVGRPMPPCMPPLGQLAYNYDLEAFARVLTAVASR
jgi:two-component system sensor histidine kinase/response regulator